MCCYLVEIFFSSFRNRLVVLVRAAFDLHKQSPRHLACLARRARLAPPRRRLRFHQSLLQRRNLCLRDHCTLNRRAKLPTEPLKNRINLNISHYTPILSNTRRRASKSFNTG